MNVNNDTTAFHYVRSCLCAPLSEPRIFDDTLEAVTKHLCSTNGVERLDDTINLMNVRHSVNQNHNQQYSVTLTFSHKWVSLAITIKKREQ